MDFFIMKRVYFYSSAGVAVDSLVFEFLPMIQLME